MRNDTPPYAAEPRSAHYAAAQVHALTGDWPAAEAAYERCAAAAAAAAAPAPGAYAGFFGQARFCVGTARARQGRHEAALEAYAASEAAGYHQPHALAQARGAALLALGRHGEAAAAVDGALAAPVGPGVVDMGPVLRGLRARIEEELQRQDGDSASGGGGSGVL